MADASGQSPPAGHTTFAMATTRLEALSDGIFAFAMTLLVLTIDVPSTGVSPASLPALLLGMQHQFVMYAIAFFVLAGFWFSHHKLYNVIRHVDGGLLWMNILALLFIVLVPFSTSLMSDYPEIPLAAIVFHANLFIIGIIFFLQGIYASRSGLTDPEIERTENTARWKRSLCTPVAAVIAILVSFVSPSWSSISYLFVPLLARFLR